MPRAAKPPSATSATPAAAAAASSSSASSSKKDLQEPDLRFLEEVKLEGEDEDCVPVYDSCDEIRRKIRQFLNDNKITQVKFRQLIGGVNPGSFTKFMRYRGEGSGAENGTFYGAYIFFEKKRIFEKKAKGKRRLDSEKKYPHGRPLEDDSRFRVTYCVKGDRAPPTLEQVRMSV